MMPPYHATDIPLSLEPSKPCLGDQARSPSLSSLQIEQFQRDGFLLLENVLAVDTLTRLALEFEQWKENSRQYTEPYSETYDKRPRFDIEAGYSADKPALRRIASPIEIYDTYLKVMRDNWALDAVSDILGKNLKFNSVKINSKQSGAAMQVKFHQDFLFEPHT